MITRLLFIGPYKLVDSVISLQFDSYLIPKPDKTIVHVRLLDPSIDVLAIYTSYGIDTSTFTVIEDLDFLCNINIDDQLLHQYGGGWIAQQLLKFLALDNTISDHFLIQDSDTFAIKPYRYLIDNVPNWFVLKHRTLDPRYYDYLYKFTGVSRQTTDSFVADFAPLSVRDWMMLKSHIESRSGTEWLETMISSFKNDNEPIGFSEYELMGNWMVAHSQLRIQAQEQIHVTDDDIVDIKNRTYTLPNKTSIDVIGFKNFIRLDFSDIDYIVNLIKGKNENTKLT